MGSRFVLPLLLFVIAALAGGLYWMSQGDGGRAVADGPLVAAAAPDRAPESLDRPSEELEETKAVTPTSKRTELDQPEPSASKKEERKKKAGVSLKGRVVDEDGRGVGGAMVLASDHSSSLPLDWELDGMTSQRLQSVTDANGGFTLEGLEAGTARFAVRASGFAPLDEEVPVYVAEEIELEPFRLSRGAILSGRVLDHDGRPIEGAELRVQKQHMGFFFVGNVVKPDAVTDSNGSFEIDKLACGKWEIRVESEEHPARNFEGLADRPGQRVSGLEFQLDQGTTIAGVVVDAPIEEMDGLFVSARPRRTGDLASFTAFQDSRRAEVGDDGRFTIKGVELDQEYLLEARAEEREEGLVIFGGRSRSDQVTARAGDRNVNLRYQPASTVAFRVLDSKTREPITDFHVDYGTDFLQPLRGEDNRALTTHPDGYARIDRLRLPTDTHRLKLEVRATGYETFRRDDIALPRGDVMDLGRIFLDPVPVLVVTVGDRTNGNPIEGARVSLKEPAGPGMRVEHRVSIGDDDEEGIRIGGAGNEARTNAEGVAVLTAPEGKTRTLRVEAPGFAAYELPDLFFPIGEDVDQEVFLSLGGAVAVRTFTPEGDPKSGVRIGHRSPGERQSGMFSFGSDNRRQVTNPEGLLLFENLEPGVHSFKIDDGEGPGAFFAGESMVQISGMGGGEDDEWTKVEVVEGETVEVSLYASPIGSLEGTVNEAGLPLAGATLSLVDEKQSNSPMAGMALPGMNSGPKARTDGRGAYRFEDVKEGRYVLKIEHPTRHMANEFNVTVRSGENDFDVELDVAIIEGRITGEDGKPVQGLKVSAEKAVQEGGARRFVMIMNTDGGDTVVSGGEELNAADVYTDADGRYTLRGVAVGVELIVKAEGPTVQDGQSEPVELSVGEVRRGMDFECAPAGSIIVEAVLPDGSPARFCMVRANYQGEDADGVGSEFGFLESGSTTLNGLKPGKWLVSVDKEGPGGGGNSGGAVEQVVEVIAGEKVTETFQLD